jgi:hypothetical protein
MLPDYIGKGQKTPDAGKVQDPCGKKESMI